MPDHLLPLHLPGCSKEDREHKDRLSGQASAGRHHPRLWQNRGGEAVRSGQGVTAALQMGGGGVKWGGKKDLGTGGFIRRPQGSCRPSSYPSGS